MRPEDVPSDLVARVWALLESRGVETMADDLQYVLAAVIPEIQARALRDAADELDLPGSSATGYYASVADGGYNEAEYDIEAWLVTRADRLTATTKETPDAG